MEGGGVTYFRVAWGIRRRVTGATLRCMDAYEDFGKAGGIGGEGSVSGDFELRAGFLKSTLLRLNQNFVTAASSLAVF